MHTGAGGQAWHGQRATVLQFTAPRASPQLCRSTCPPTCLPLRIEAPSGPWAVTRPQGPWHTAAAGGRAAVLSSARRQRSRPSGAARLPRKELVPGAPAGAHGPHSSSARRTHVLTRHHLAGAPERLDHLLHFVAGAVEANAVPAGDEERVVALQGYTRWGEAAAVTEPARGAAPRGPGLGPPAPPLPPGRHPPALPLGVPHRRTWMPSASTCAALLVDWISCRVSADFINAAASGVKKGEPSSLEAASQGMGPPATLAMSTCGEQGGERRQGDGQSPARVLATRRAPQHRGSQPALQAPCPQASASPALPASMLGGRLTWKPFSRHSR